MVYMVCMERKEGPSHPLPSLARWGKVTSTSLLYLCVICRPVASSQELLWGIMKFLPRNMIYQQQLSSQLSVWCWCTTTCPGLQAGILMVRDCFVAALLISGTWPGCQLLPNLSYSSSAHFLRGWYPPSDLGLCTCYTFCLDNASSFFRSQFKHHFLQKAFTDLTGEQSIPAIGLAKKFLRFLSKNKRHIFHFHEELYWTTYSPFCSANFCHFPGNFVIPSSQNFLSFWARNCCSRCLLQYSRELKFFSIKRIL